MTTSRRVALILLLLLTSCSSATPASDAAELTTTALSPPATTTTTSTTTTLPPETTTTELKVDKIPAPELISPGTITVGPLVMDFSFECYAAGAGDVLAVGVGTFPDSDITTEAVVQAFFGHPYVAVVVDADTVFELAIDRQAELFVQDGTIRGSALRFVNANAGLGEGDQLGLGSVVVSCDSYAPGLPEGYVREVADDA
ncbi:MAG: hypothetical protein HKN94_07065 [Acidimicrobiales bacterium]|nr:hypothetical protein [Acidimicrobiales bacterium]RZV44472.1 MAG: hypothetical protein EX269_11675 [Acidimicrobiales bacterium]